MKIEIDQDEETWIVYVDGEYAFATDNENDLVEGFIEAVADKTAWFNDPLTMNYHVKVAKEAAKRGQTIAEYVLDTVEG